jgi:hypothetical protein
LVYARPFHGEPRTTIAKRKSWLAATASVSVP